MFLAGDVGGTKTNLALFEVEAGRLARKSERSFHSADFHGLAEVAHGFLSEGGPPIEGAGFGIAGPIVHGRVKTTNLPWEVDGAALGRTLKTPRVILLNDLEAMAWGIEVLAPGEFRTLQEGTPDEEGGAALIAAGTGLGEALLVRHEGRFLPRPTEGGHGDFAPNDPDADGFLAWLRKGLGHVSAERVASGLGLAGLYGYLHEDARGGAGAHHADGEDTARLVAEAAQAGSCPACAKAFDLFLRGYGAEAGNLALKTGATAGLYVGGGIAAKNLEAMEDGRFIRAFRAKGRYEEYMRRIPVRVILNQSAPLLGAALAIARALGKM